jgi:Co/Zn/Cd efflux system component
VPISYSRKHANGPKFTFGTGKLGDLAGFTIATILAVISAVDRQRVRQTHLPAGRYSFRRSILIACLGLALNIAMLCGGHDQNRDHGQGHTLEEGGHEKSHGIAIAVGSLASRYLRTARRHASSLAPNAARR